MLGKGIIGEFPLGWILGAVAGIKTQNYAHSWKKHIPRRQSIRHKGLSIFFFLEWKGTRD